MVNWTKSIRVHVSLLNGFSTVVWWIVIIIIHLLLAAVAKVSFIFFKYFYDEVITLRSGNQTSQLLTSFAHFVRWVTKNHLILIPGVLFNHHITIDLILVTLRTVRFRLLLNSSRFLFVHDAAVEHELVIGGIPRDAGVWNLFFRIQ